MNIRVSVKQLGKKHPILHEKSIDLNTSIPNISSHNLIELVVAYQVDLFNTSAFEQDEVDVTHLPKENYLPVLIDTGKVGFGAVYNHNKIDLAIAINNALLAFEDGIYTIFYGDDEITDLAKEINLEENKPLTFIRLTFLAGTYW